jgi:hypothetical protein
MLSTPIESRAFWLGRVSDAATTPASECPDGNPKPSEVGIRYFSPSDGQLSMQAQDLSKYKLPAVLVGMVAVVLAISLTAFLTLEQLPLRDIWHHLTQRAIGLSSSLGSVVPSTGTEPTARLFARPRQGAVSRGPTPLGLAVEGRAENAVVIIAGLVPDMELSAGNMVASDKWQISVAELGKVWIAPPDNFSGSIDLIAELHLSDGNIADRVPIRVEWVSPRAPPPAQHENALEEAQSIVALASPSAAVDQGESLLERPLMPSPVHAQPDRAEGRVSEISSPLTPSSPDREEIAAQPPPAPAPSLSQLEHQEIAASGRDAEVSSAVTPSSPDREEIAAHPAPAPAPSVPQLEQQKIAATGRDAEVSSAVTPSSPDREKIAAHPPRTPASSLPHLEHQEIAASPPISRPPAQGQFDQKQIIVLLNRGKDLMANGDLAAARIVLRRAVDANNAEAALALAATYDPFVLRELKVYGFTGDAAMARTWYAKAAELGSSVALRRLERLAEGRTGR